ncbi:hypothetical protein HELRODRAFT_186101 [Helobdella robusta]|uniref:Mitochondrial-processing peptidase subunit alpha n=1 Tax=Helobdella robusta TaxID=6412 RepID=T1FNN5_HELRO|nr:hypothetical protein HELRODRAFT_186101 [Helobdella robusta]ESN93385.1 hypothetical protein HELRODRAFT_186101 [Helobdella robusta]
MAALNRIKIVFNYKLQKNLRFQHKYTNQTYSLNRRHLSSSIVNPLLSSNPQNPVDKVTNIPLTHSIPWLANPQYAIPTTDQHDTKVTKLENGLQVATQAKFGMFCTVGVLIDSGSRYEVHHKSGTSHFLEKLAFSSTSKFPNKDAILQTLENHGGICDCQGSRDTLIYAVSASADGLPDVVELLSQVTLKPSITNEEIEYARQAIEFELESINMRPDPEPLLVELIHSAAYVNNTLGLPKMCPAENVSQIDRGTILNYFNQYHTPERMVLAGVGVDHEELVALARRHFTSQPTWTGDPVVNTHPKNKDLSVAQYTGGSREVVKDLSDVSLGPTPMPELAHFVVGLESCSHKHEDFVATCVLNMLMGGGGSFSAGGPGKGMYTRLYLNVLNRHHWIHNATAFNHAYNDSGLFCIHASSHPSSLKELTDVILRELVNTQNDISPDELNRAKTQLQSMLLMNLEARPVVFEDVGRQVLSNGKRMPSEYYCDLIQKITEADVQRVARKMLTSRPSVAALGNLNELPKYDDIRNVINSHIGSLSKRFSLFRSS